MKDKEYKYMVGVRCFTFNQSKYILDALNGFVMQQTNFPYVVMVVDDASTDGEQEVIRKFVDEQFDTNDTSVAYEKETDYAIVTYAQHKVNRNCYIAVLYLKENHHSQRKTKIPYLSEWRDCTKYEALCEGDDYWIHPQKLQMQVDFMEENEDCSLCFHGAEVINERLVYDNRTLLFQDITKREYKSFELFENWIVPTASIIYKKDVQIIKDSRFIVGDNPLILSCAKAGTIYCFSEIKMSVYRLINTGSVSKGFIWNKQIEHYRAILDHFGEYVGSELVNRKIIDVYTYTLISVVFRLKKGTLKVIKSILFTDYKLIVQIAHNLYKRIKKI